MVAARYLQRNNI
ncbi:Protein of unknown function [Bacillus mycoides]|nr:Protein of unknown function [Bacillus mycoides]